MTHAPEQHGDRAIALLGECSERRPLHAGGAPVSLRAAAQQPLIVELYGPSAAGKSTLARALVAALEARGLPARLETSARPAETTAAGGGRRVARSKLIAPVTRAAKIFRVLPSLLPGRHRDPVAEGLLALMARRRWLRTLRLRRYLDDLGRKWSAAKAGRGVIVYDQAYLSVLCSLELQIDPRDRQRLSRALDLAPKPDLAVYLEAPPDVLRERLRDRLASQSRLERLFEYSEAACLGQVAVVSMLSEQLAERNQPALRLRSLAPGDVGPAVEEIIAALVSLPGHPLP